MKGHKHTQEWKDNNSKLTKGRILSDDWKNKIGKANKGKKRTQEQKNNLSSKLKGRVAWNKGQTGEKSQFWKGGISKDKARYKRARRNRELKAEGSNTNGEWELLKIQYGFTCPCCKRKEPEVKLTRDHIIPLSKGGSDYIENIQPLCMNCNCKKSAKTITYLIS